MTGILAECCNECMLSDSIMEKKRGISGLSIVQTVLSKEQENKRERQAHACKHNIQYKP